MCVYIFLERERSMNMDNAISPDNDHSHHKSGSAAVAFFVYLAFIFAIFIVIICSLEFCGGCHPVVPIPETDDDAAADDSSDGDEAPIQVVIQRDALPPCNFHQLKDAAAASTCTICLADYKAGEAVRVMPECCHVFHRSCIDRWLRIHATCPACRNPMLPPPLQ